MPRALALVAVALVLAPAVAIELAGPAQQEYEKAARTILCDCGCHPQSIHDCACGRAEELRQEIAGFVGQGMDGDQIIAHYVARGGEQVRIVPTARGFNLVAWVGPLAGLLLGLGATLLLARRWQRRSAPVGAPVAPSAPIDPTYLERLRREVEEQR
ncbi:MAG TPA: cytochrome c-type biogenesis protein CcmH [Candidatus Polarisedimenticolaceae bacterium]|nr:cytochrome c-type biogenesis protein CcmH [Candidatus Polarisedimenticolaceae bacterium]